MLKSGIIIILLIFVIIQEIIHEEYKIKNKNKVIVVEYKDDSYTRIIKIHQTAYDNIGDAVYFAYKHDIKYFKIFPITY